LKHFASPQYADTPAKAGAQLATCLMRELAGSPPSRGWRFYLGWRPRWKWL